MPQRGLLGRLLDQTGSLATVAKRHAAQVRPLRLLHGEGGAGAHADERALVLFAQHSSLG